MVNTLKYLLYNQNNLWIRWRAMKNGISASVFNPNPIKDKIKNSDKDQIYIRKAI
jgi:hypothetical protein